MIRYKDKIFPEYFIDPVTAIITNSKGEIQETYLNQGRLIFKGHKVYEWQMHTYLGYKKGFDIHHLDHNKMNNALSNLVYLTHSEHSKIHGKNMSEETKLKIGEASKGKKLSDETKRKMSEAQKGNKNMLGKHHSEESKQKMSEAAKGRIFSEETKQKISEAKKGNKNMLGKHHSEESKQKMSEAHKGNTSNVKDRIWVNNGVISKMVKCEEIPTGFIRGRLKKINGDAFIKLCYAGFKKNDKKFPNSWTLEDYKKYAEECNRILAKENEEKTF